jgi:hypothetical protein
MKEPWNKVAQQAASDEVEGGLYIGNFFKEITNC